MWKILGILFLGLIIGYIFRDKLNENFLNKVVMLFIYILLFFMGVNIGMEAEIVSNLTTFGWQALLLSIGSIVGSIFVILLVYHFEFKIKKK